MMERLLSVMNLGIGYDSVLVSNISFEIKQGEIIAIVGESGIGKTTLLRTLAGLVSPLGGKFELFVKKRGGVGYIPQKLGLVRHASVEHNVSLGARAGAAFSLWLTKDQKKKCDSAMAAVKIDGKSTEPVRRLSGGQQRRVATARTLAQSPQLILADEFLSELDDDNVEIVLNAISELISNGSAMIMVEHHEERAREIANRLWKIENGRLIEEVIR